MKELKIFLKIVWYVLNNKFELEKPEEVSAYGSQDVDVYSYHEKGLQLRVSGYYVPRVNLRKYRTGTPIGYEFGNFQAQVISAILNDKASRAAKLKRKKEKKELLNNLDI
jgi:hypothetical protein